MRTRLVQCKRQSRRRQGTNRKNLAAPRAAIGAAEPPGSLLGYAAYLELALRLALPLATLDEDLRTAADRQDVRLLGQ